MKIKTRIRNLKDFPSTISLVLGVIGACIFFIFFEPSVNKMVKDSTASVVDSLISVIAAKDIEIQTHNNKQTQKQ